MPVPVVHIVATTLVTNDSSAMLTTPLLVLLTITYWSYVGYTRKQIPRNYNILPRTIMVFSHTVRLCMFA